MSHTSLISLKYGALMTHTSAVRLLLAQSYGFVCITSQSRPWVGSVLIMISRIGSAVSSLQRQY